MIKTASKNEYQKAAENYVKDLELKLSDGEFLENFWFFFGGECDKFAPYISRKFDRVVLNLRKLLNPPKVVSAIKAVKFSKTKIYRKY